MPTAPKARRPALSAIGIESNAIIDRGVTVPAARTTAKPPSATWRVDRLSVWPSTLGEPLQRGV
jgi:hypothetical protein